MAEPGSVAYNADFTANTSQGQQSLKDYQAQISAVKTAIREQTREAKQAYQEQMLAARASGASTEQLTKIQQQYAQQQLALKNTQKDLTDQILKGNFSAMESEEALKKVRLEAIATIEKEVRAIRELAAANEGHVVSGQSAASGAVQLLDGRGGIRTIENFLGNTLGLGGFFTMMFPVVGAIQSAKLVYDLGEKVYELGEKSHQAGQKLNEALDEHHTKSQITIADLTIQGDKIQDNIDKLSGHPSNGLRTALDEAKKASLEFNQSLIENRKQVAALFKEYHVGNIGGWLSGTTPTGSDEKQLTADMKEYERQAAKINSGIDAKIARAGNQNDVDALEKKRNQRQNELWSRTRTSWQQRRQDLNSDNLVTDVDARTGRVTYTRTDRNNARIGMIDNALDQYQGSIDQYNARYRVADLTKQDLALKGQKEGSAQAAEALRKSDQAQKQYWDQRHAEWETETERSSSDEAGFWINAASKMRAGSEGYKDALQKVGSEIQKAHRDTLRLSKDNDKIGTEMDADFGKRFSSETEKALDAASKQTRQWIESLAQLGQAQDAAKYQVAESSIQFDLAAGRISHYDAAMQLQALHTEQYLSQVEKLNGIINDPNQTATARTNAQTQLVELNARRGSQQMQDTAAVAQTTVGGALKQANQLWLQNTQNLAPQIVSIYTNVFQGMNQQITNLLAGQKMSWSSFFRSIAAQFAGIGLNALEAPLMQRASSGGFMKSLSSIPVIGGLFGGFRASGGPVEAGKTYIVGEHGPEPVKFGSSAVMGTNRDFQAMTAGGTQHNYEIHVGNGVTPEQFHQTMKQLIPDIHRKAVSEAVRTVSERNRRMPSTAQR